jgi:hypothetical protein
MKRFRNFSQNTNHCVHHFYSSRYNFSSSLCLSSQMCRAGFTAPRQKQGLPLTHFKSGMGCFLLILLVQTRKSLSTVSRCRTLKPSNATYAPDNEPFTVASLSAKPQGLSILRNINKFFEGSYWATKGIGF